MLWGEGLEGLAVSKEKIDLLRADGSRVELNGDLRARKGFIAELREIVRLLAETTGEIIRGQSVEQNFAVQIVMPTPPSTNVPVEEPVVIDIAPPTYRGSG